MSRLVQSPGENGAVIVPNAQSRRSTPDWLAPSVVVAQSWRESGLLAEIRRRVKVPRGRAGSFEATDFVLALLGFAVSREPFLKHYFDRLGEDAATLGAVWGRRPLPSPEALSRFLGAVPPSAVAAFSQVCFADLLRRGLHEGQMGGLWDRVGKRHLLFDVDGTRKAVRLRALVEEDAYPPPRRRSTAAFAPGYTGRKRGEAVRTRTTLQQAHTQEWLGTWLGVGNGDLWGELELACQRAVAYLKHHGMAPGDGLMRLDGIYGWVQGAAIVAAHGLGYLMRCSDYRLLSDPRVLGRLAEAPAVRWQASEETTPREVVDVGPLQWVAGGGSDLSVQARLLVTMREAAPGETKPKVGKRIRGRIYELFMSDRQGEGLSAPDLLSLYLGRGGFEGTLAQEDREEDGDRLVSWQPEGQGLWQVVSQAVWNTRVRLGSVVHEGVVERRTQWAAARQGVESLAEAAPAAAVAQEAPAATEVQTGAVQSAQATGPSLCQSRVALVEVAAAPAAEESPPPSVGQTPSAVVNSPAGELFPPRGRKLRRGGGGKGSRGGSIRG